MNIIADAVENLISEAIPNPGRYISEYEDLSGTADCLFVDEEVRAGFKTEYGLVRKCRENLSHVSDLDFSDLNSESMSRLVKYFDAVKVLFRDVFSKRLTGTPAVICEEILGQIISSDISPISEGKFYKEGTETVGIGVGNPMILESLYLAKLQKDDLEKLNESYGRAAKTGVNAVMGLVNGEIFANCVDRLFRNIVFVYKKSADRYKQKFYRIIGYDFETFRFVARLEDDLPGNTPINANALYEKMAGNLDEFSERDSVKCLVLGEVAEGTDNVLNWMLNGRSPSVRVDFVGDRDEIRRILTSRAELEKKISEYDKVFVLDCSDWSDLVVVAAPDASAVINSTARSFCELTDIDYQNEIRDFYNINWFAALYYRVQNFFVYPDAANCFKSRRVRTAYVDYLQRLFERDADGKVKNADMEGKEVYVFFSETEDFDDPKYGNHPCFRAERLGGVTYKVFKYPEDVKILSSSQDKKIYMNYFRFVTAISDSSEFLCKMTGFDKEGVNEETVRKATDIARKSVICLEYGALRELQGQRYDMKVTSDKYIPLDCFKSDDKVNNHIGRLEILFREVFNPQDRDELTRNKLVSKIFQSSFATCLGRYSKNFNDFLFHHLYEKKCRNARYGIDYTVVFNHESRYTIGSEPTEEIKASSRPDDVSFAYKNFVYNLIDGLDGDVYRESDIVSQNRGVQITGENLMFFSDAIEQSCRNLNYTKSALYLRLEKYYK